LSEVKPSVEEFWSDELVLPEEERRQLATLQDEHNRAVRRRASGSQIVVNYLAHFEGPETFGCNAGTKMVYVDAFGEVSPCVFLPLSFGNVRERSLAEILADMGGRFRAQERCFCNTNYRLLQEADATGSGLPLDRGRSVTMLERVEFGPPSEFNRRLQGPRIVA
jgi:MoaA/NifB/PqqE/SkfB family radical SAM enzyme